MPQVGHDSLRLMTLRSNDQFNTTVYGYDDRFRGIKNTRKVVLMNRSDIDRLGLKVGQAVTLRTVADDGVDRALSGLLVVAYDIPIGCIGGYYPNAMSSCRSGTTPSAARPQPPRASPSRSGPTATG